MYLKKIKIIKSIALTFFLGLVLSSFVYTPAGAETSQKTETSPLYLKDLAGKLAQKGETKKAEKALTLAIKKIKLKHGAKSPLISPYLLDLGTLLHRRQALKKANAVFSHAIKLRTSSPQNTDDVVGILWSKLARVQIQQKFIDDAIASLSKAVQLKQETPHENELNISADRLELARLYARVYRVLDAQKLIDKVITYIKKKPDNVLKARAYQAFGELSLRQSKFREALEHYQLAYRLRQSLYPANHPEIALSHSSIASVLKTLGQYERTEELYRQSINIYEENFGPNHPYIAIVLNNMGQLYYLQGRYEEAETALTKAISISKSRSFPDYPLIAGSSNHLGYLYFKTNQFKKAAPYFDQALKIWSSQQHQRPRYVANVRSWVGGLNRALGNDEVAEQNLNSALSSYVKIFGENSPIQAEALHQRALLNIEKDNIKDAQLDLRRSIDFMDSLGGPQHIGAIEARTTLAKLLKSEKNTPKALSIIHKATDGLQLRIQQNSGERTHSLASEISSLRGAVETHLSILNDMERNDIDVVSESFQTAQISRTASAAQALTKMSARLSLSEEPFAHKVREQQALTESWKEIDNRLSAAFLLPSSERNFFEENQLRKTAKSLRVKVKKLSSEITEIYPQYGELISNKPTKLKTIQNLLRPNEAMLVYFVGDDNSYIWALSKDKSLFKAIDLKGAKIDRYVRRLRRSLVPRNIQNYEDIRPVPVKLAANLYKKLIEPALPVISGKKQLIIVPDGGLQSLPFGVLISKGNFRPKAPSDHAQIHWLIKDYAISVLPSISSLKVLRLYASQNKSGQKPFLGIGDPHLKNVKLGNKKRSAMRTKRNVESPSGPKTSPRIRGVNTLEILQSMIELPETADELRQISKTLGGSPDNLYLRDNATEEKIRSIQFEKYKVVHFATHGLMAGEFQGLKEPALVLTPPSKITSSLNDGLLTASEIAQLNLNADWVILSACNTAAPDGTPGAEGLSGLAKGFFFAGGRSLLVSHWEVVSDATVKLTSNLFSIAQKNPQLSKAEAHRRAMLSLMKDKTAPHLAHPMFWAPFIIVGEGG